MRKNIAVILAGGIGSRFGFYTPKQFFKLAGRTVIEHTVEAFEINDNIDHTTIVSNPFYISQVESLILKNNWKKVNKVISGGKERYNSSLSAVQAYAHEKVNLIFHEAVRPLVTQRIINDVIATLKSYRAVDVAIPSTDTIIQVNGDFIEHIPDRSRQQRGQTPQAFHIELIREAYSIALKDPEFKVTDDCGVVKKYMPEEEIYVVKGEESNMKLTFPEDTYLLDKYLQLRKNELEEVRLEPNVFLNKVAVVFGGSYGIGKEIVTLLNQYGAKAYEFSRSSTQTDISSREDVREALKGVFEKEQRIDYVINPAAVLKTELLMNADYETICETVNVNYLGAVHIAMEAFEYLKETKGKLLFFTSNSYIRGRAFCAVYSSTKAAIVNFVQAIAQEWEPLGIQVNCINPERTTTPMRVKNFGIEPESSLLTPQQVASVSVQSLLKDFTGQVIDIKKKDEK